MIDKKQTLNTIKLCGLLCTVGFGWLFYIIFLIAYWSGGVVVLVDVFNEMHVEFVLFSFLIAVGTYTTVSLLKRNRKGEITL